MSHPILIAGPCAAENEAQLLGTAKALFDELSLQKRKLDFFRAGVWKPRSQPDTFSGLGEQALPWLQQVQSQFYVPVCVEVTSPFQLDLCEKYNIKAVWIGARTSVNPIDVQEIANAAKGRGFTVMVKNPLVADLKLWLGNVERFLNDDTTKVMSIHRGFADTKESVFRNNPCWELAIDFKVHFPQVPLLCDPSHIAGKREYIAQLSQMALDYGFDGLMVEVHQNPDAALSDEKQQLNPQDFASVLASLNFKDSISTPAENELRKQRTLINNIDTQLSVLLRKRMEVVDAIAQIKKTHNLPVVQPEQWKKVVSIYIDKSKNDADYEEFINEFLELLHQSSIKRQRN